MESVQIFSFSGDTTLQYTLGKLKFLSKIRQGEKINCKDLFIRDNDSILQRFLRTVRNYGNWMTGADIPESKEATLIFIRDTINQSINLIMTYHTDDPFKKNIANIIVQNLEESKKGIQNLISTYQWDRKFISDAEAMIQTLEVRINSLKDNGYMNGISDESFMPPFKDELEELKE